MRIDIARSPQSILSGPQGNHDVLSLKLHGLSQRLTSLELYDISISYASLFWPRKATESGTGPCWPHLTLFLLTYTLTTPSGHFLNAVPRSSASVDSEEYQVSTSLSRLDRLYHAAGLAAKHMPALNFMRLQSVKIHGIVWGFVYQTKGVDKGGTAIWNSTRSFVPAPEVQEVWRGVQSGSEVDIRYVQGNGYA